MNIKIKPKKNISGKVKVPGDKSISHRALILGAIAQGITETDGFLHGEDCLATCSCLRQLGVEIELCKGAVRILGKGLHGLKKPSDVLYAGNSGTTMRLLAGLLACQSFDTVLDGDASLRRRPMKRIVTPLSHMGADIKGDFAPVYIKGTDSKLHGIHYKMPMHSAQVKSAVLLAGLYAAGPVTVEELKEGLTRNHTENMMRYTGADLHIDGTKITYMGGVPLGRKITVPGDFSSAAYFIVAGILLAQNGLIIENVGINPTRTGLLDALLAMGADITIKDKRIVCGEEVGNIEVRRSVLKAVTLAGDIVPRMIDEIPVFAVAAANASGTTVIKDAEELAVKESNRINVMVNELTKMGVRIKAMHDGMVIHGGDSLKGAVLNSHGDHRAAMSLAVAGAAADSESVITDADCVNVSFPGFFDVFLR